MLKIDNLNNKIKILKYIFFLKKYFSVFEVYFLPIKSKNYKKYFDKIFKIERIKICNKKA